MSTLKPKNWVFLIPEDATATSILYAPLHKIAVRVSPQAGDLLVPILDGRQEDVTDSPQKDELMGFLASNNLLELPKEWVPEQSNTGKGKAKITMSLTNKCNLRCIYCYAKTGMDYTTMTWEIAKDAIDSVIREAEQNGEKKFGITFHGGGEATVELKFLRKCVAYIQEQARVYDLKPSLGMVTNATLITKPIAVWMGKHFSNVTVSFDGLEEVQDYQRPDSRGKGTFVRVIRGIQNLMKVGIKPSIRATVTDFGVNRMANFVEYLAKEVFPKGGSIHFEPMSLCGRAADNELTTNPQTYMENYLKAKEVGKKVGMEVTCSFDTFGHEKKQFCGANRSTMFCVSPHGLVSACSRVTKPTDDGAELFFYARHNSQSGGFDVDPDAVSKIIAHGNLPENPCVSCFARWNCQGHCPIARYAYHEHHEQSCIIIQELLKSAIIAELDKNL